MKKLLLAMAVVLSACTAPDGFVTVDPNPIREVMPRTLGYARAYLESTPESLERSVRLGDVEVMELWLAQVLSVSLAEVRAVAPVLAPDGASEEQTREILRRQAATMEAQAHASDDLALPLVPD